MSALAQLAALLRKRGGASADERDALAKLAAELGEPLPDLAAENEPTPQDERRAAELSAYLMFGEFDKAMRLLGEGPVNFAARFGPERLTPVHTAVRERAPVELLRAFALTPEALAAQDAHGYTAFEYLPRYDPKQELYALLYTPDRSIEFTRSEEMLELYAPFFGPLRGARHWYEAENIPEKQQETVNYVLTSDFDADELLLLCYYDNAFFKLNKKKILALSNKRLIATTDGKTTNSFPYEGLDPGDPELRKILNSVLGKEDETVPDLLRALRDAGVFPQLAELARLTASHYGGHREPALRAYPEEYKLKYLQLFAAIIRADGLLHAREQLQLYEVFCELDCSLERRRTVLLTMESPNAFDKLLDDFEELVKDLPETEKRKFIVSLDKDLHVMARIDAEVHETEFNLLQKFERRFGVSIETTTAITAILNLDKEVHNGKLDAKQYGEQLKAQIRAAEDQGAPLAALFFSGSVMSLGTAALDKGLDVLNGWLEAGVEIPELHDMVAGLLGMAAGGLSVFQGLEFLKSNSQRVQHTRRRRLVEALLENHRNAQVALSDDLAWLSEERLSPSAEYASDLSALFERLKAARDAGQNVQRQLEAHYEEALRS